MATPFPIANAPTDAYAFGMADETEKSRAGRVVSCAGALVVGVPLFYVLSLGPAVVFAHKVPSSSAALDVIYSPLELLHNRTFLREPLDEYVNFWEQIGGKI